MPTGKVISDTFETVGETIAGTARKTKTAIRGVTPLPDSLKAEEQPAIDPAKATEGNKDNIAETLLGTRNSDPIDHDKLDEGYMKQVRGKLFKLFKEEGTRAMRERQQKEQKRKAKQSEEEEEKNVKERKKHEEEPREEPTTKKKRGQWFGLRKKQETAEFKPGSGKQ